MRLRDEDAVSAVALVVESENAEQDAVGDQPLSLGADGTADETALEEEVVPGDADADELLDVPEVESDAMPDSDIEE